MSRPRAADDFDAIREGMERLRGVPTAQPRVMGEAPFVSIDELRTKYVGSSGMGWIGNDGERVKELLGCSKRLDVCYWNANYECLRALRCKG